MQYSIDQNTINNILAPYRDEFIYLHHKNLIYDIKNKILSGEILYKGSNYLKNTAKSKIFNSVDTIIASNQIGLVLLIAAMAGNISDKKQFENYIFKNVSYVWNIIVRLQTIQYKKAIPVNIETFPFEAVLIQFRKTIKGIFFCLEINFGFEKNFSVLCKGLILDKNAH